MSSGTAHAAGSFNPSGSICLDDQTTVDPNPLAPGHAGECDGSNAAAAKVAITSSFGIQKPDYNFGLNVSFTPPQWGVADGTDVPIGAIVGKLNSNATLGLLGNPCRSPVLVPFTFVNASTNPADPIAPKAPGQKDRLSPLAADVNPQNNIPDGADKWPSYLSEVDSFSGLDPADIRARMFGVNTTDVSGLTVVLNFIIFEPGADISETQVVDPRLGYISVTVLQDPTAPASASDPVNDFCSPLLTATSIFGATEDNPNTPTNEGGVAYRTNPPDGAYSFIAASASQRDADGDGHENGLDPCPLTPDPTWDPRTNDPSGYVAGADDDADGLPNSCDPKPTQPSPLVGSIRDEDIDGWMNRSDNCPLLSNPDNLDTDSDAIGDACDPNPNNKDTEGMPVEVCTISVLEIGAGGTPPLAAGEVRDCSIEALAASLPPAPTAADADGDGVVDTKDNCPAVANAAQTDSDSDGKGDACDDSDVDGVMDAVDRCPGTAAGATVDQFGCTEAQAQEDADGDGVKNIDDECPNTAAGASVDAKGCSAAQLAAADTGGPGGPSTGVGSLAPAVSSIPTWAAIASGLGVTGLMGSIAAFFTRFTRRRR